LFYFEAMRMHSIYRFTLATLIILADASSHVSAEGLLREKLQRWRESHQTAQPQNPTSQKLTAGDYQFTLKHQGMERVYMVHMPKTYNPQNPTPMVLSLHGGGGNMRYQATEKYYHQISKSDQAGYIAVFPNGYSRFPGGKLATWNSGICCGKARDENIDDVGFIKAVIEDMKSRANIDSKRVFIDGMSNGGMMSYRAACELADSITAVASVAGTDGTKTCTPSRPISILHIHAKNDDHVLYNGGSGVKSETHADFVSVPDTISKWVKINGCNASPQRVLEVAGAYCELYTGCKDNTQVKLCVTETGGHSWPGGQKVRDTGEPASTAFNATDMIWAFFQANSAK
jgi:polyhydroxybutyrate depolymerase